MLRGQLVSNPGYMANYAIGAVIVSDLRAAARARFGSFQGAEWYPRLSASIYRWGRERSSREVIEGFLGRPLSGDALVADLERAKAAPATPSQR